MTPTKADLARFDAFRRIGCVACRKEDLGITPADVHHLLSGGRRLGHQHSIPLCPWHHRGAAIGSRRDMAANYGPSLAHGSKAFRARYGSDEHLLEYTNDLISRSMLGASTAARLLTENDNARS